MSTYFIWFNNIQANRRNSSNENRILEGMKVTLSVSNCEVSVEAGGFEGIEGLDRIEFRAVNLNSLAKGAFKGQGVKHISGERVQFLCMVRILKVPILHTVSQSQFKTTLEEGTFKGMNLDELLLKENVFDHYISTKAFSNLTVRRLK